MAEVAVEKSEDSKVKDLASRIVDAQGPEIEKLKGWLEVGRGRRRRRRKGYERDGGQRPPRGWRHDERR